MLLVLLLDDHLIPLLLIDDLFDLLSFQSSAFSIVSYVVVPYPQSERQAVLDDYWHFYTDIPRLPELALLEVDHAELLSMVGKIFDVKDVLLVVEVRNFEATRPEGPI